MPYVRRDETGRIVAVFNEVVEEGLEAVEPGDPDLQRFLGHDVEDDEVKKSFQDADIAFIRVLEDLIDILVNKGHLQINDFPEAARKKLMDRQGLRREYAYLASLFGPEEGGGSWDDGGGGSWDTGGGWDTGGSWDTSGSWDDGRGQGGGGNDEQGGGGYL